MTVTARIEGLEELQAKLSRFPGVFARGLMTTMTAVITYVWGRIPGYPPPPPNSTYKRTGTLGRTLGVDKSGHKIGKPDIFEVKQRGGTAHTSAQLGTRLSYAPDVIGDNQKDVHRGRWYRLTGVAKGAEPEVLKLFQAFANKMAAWLNDEGPPPA